MKKVITTAYATGLICAAGVALGLGSADGDPAGDPVAGVARAVDAGFEDLTSARPLNARVARELGVGSWVPDLPMTDVDGNATSLAQIAGEKGTILAIRDVGCPLSKKTGERLAQIEAEYTAKGFGFAYVNPSTVETPEDMKGEIANFGFGATYVVDADASVASALGARTTTEVFVLDPARTIRYRGAISDQAGVGFVLPEPRNTYLVDALDAVLAGGDVPQLATISPGCALELEPSEAFGTEITYHNTISRIMQNNCVSCHRADAPGPFELDEYAEVEGRSRMIEYTVREGIMPPWDAAPGTGPWHNNFSLAEREKQAIIDWIAAGKPEGDPEDAPAAIDWPSNDEWAIGEPDAIYELPETIDVQSSGTIDYIYEWVQTDQSKTRYVQAIEVKTDSPTVCHHALVFIEEPRKENEDDRRYFRRWQGGAEGYFAGYVPGQGPMIFPDGYGMKLPRKAWLKFQLHYTPDGSRHEDRIRIGFKFADEKPEKEVEITGLFNSDFTIPPGAKDFTVVAEDRINKRITIDGFSPHMHFRGKSYKYELVTPEGETILLLDVPDYDYNWQTFYELEEPLIVEKGSKLICTAVFDNSDENPRNPDPDVAVSFGDQTWDEMMIGYYRWWAMPRPLLVPAQSGATGE